MMQREAIALYTVNHMKLINTLRVKNAEFSNVNVGAIRSYNCGFK
jgi:hypothetical protein